MHRLTLFALHVAGLFTALILSGCLAQPASPSGLPLPGLTKINSARVMIGKAWFETKDGRLYLRGHVHRQDPAADEDTSRTHLVITLFNARNERLREVPVEFAPRKIPYGRHLQGYSGFSVMLDPLPAHTDRIEIRAVDEPAPRREPADGTRTGGR